MIHTINYTKSQKDKYYMKILKKLILIVFVFITAYDADGQVSGYMGKTFEVSYSNKFFLSKLNMNNGDFPLFSMNNFRLEKTVARNASFVVSFDIFTAFVNMEQNYFYSNQYDQSGYLKEFTISNQDNIFSVNSKVIGIHYRIYTQNWLSPVGSYYSFGIYSLTANSKDYLSHTLEAKGVLNKKIFRKQYLAFSYGKKIMLNNTISFHVGINSAISIFSTDSLLDDDINFEDVNDYFQYVVKVRLRKMMLINVEVGLGVLLF